VTEIPPDVADLLNSVVRALDGYHRGEERYVVAVGISTFFKDLMVLCYGEPIGHDGYTSVHIVLGSPVALQDRHWWYYPEGVQFIRKMTPGEILELRL